MAIPSRINDLDSATRQISASAATIYAYSIRNRNAYPIYVKFYNKLAVNVNETSDTPALTVTVAADSTATDETSHAFATALSARVTTHSLNYDTNSPAVCPEIELQLTASGGGASEVQAGTSVIQAALDAASAGDTVYLAAGTFVEDGGIEIPNDVHLKGAGLGKTIFQSKLVGTSAPFHGIVAPGNNSVIEDISFIGVSPTGTGNEHVNAISARAGCTKTWTNVTFRRCHLYGLADCIISNGGTSLGDITFIDCTLESQNDIVMWQSASNAVFINCVFRHTTTTGNEGNSFTAIYDGESGGTVKAYGCRTELRGVTPDFLGTILFEAGSHVEIHDMVVDLGGFSDAALDDLAPDEADALIVSNLRRSDGKPVKVSGNGAIANIGNNLFPINVAYLPTAPAFGQQALVKDGTASLAWGATVTGGGSTKYLVHYNGAAWTVVGK